MLYLCIIVIVNQNHRQGSETVCLVYSTSHTTHINMLNAVHSCIVPSSKEKFSQTSLRKVAKHKLCVWYTPRTMLNGVHSSVGDLDHLIQGNETCLVWCGVVCVCVCVCVVWCVCVCVCEERVDRKTVRCMCINTPPYIGMVRLRMLACGMLAKKYFLSE